jgi:hypothetical protein
MLGNLCIPYLTLDELVVKTQTGRKNSLVEGIQIKDLWACDGFDELHNGHVDS